MKKAQVFYFISLIAISGAAFFAGMHWERREVEAQPVNMLSAQLACEASSLEGDIAVA